MFTTISFGLKAKALLRSGSNIPDRSPFQTVCMTVSEDGLKTPSKGHANG
jgi:hypothetical protein